MATLSRVDTSPQNYPIADFLKWDKDKELELSPTFQRGQVWNESAKSYLINTILRGYPVPKILFRANIDLATQRVIREVVDGQQRLRSILGFAKGDYKLGARGGEFAGMRYADLEDADKTRFLSYKLTADQLVNATDEDVIEVFSRVNAYTVPVLPAELRNAKYDSDFKWAVKDVVKGLATLWQLEVLSTRERVRMYDDALVAEMFSFLIHGVRDGGAAILDKLYEELKDGFDKKLTKKVTTLGKSCATLLADFHKQPVAGAPHVLMLFAALAYADGALPQGRISDEAWKSRGKRASDDRIIERLRDINSILSAEEPPSGHEVFWTSSKSTTHRVASRQARFPYFVRAVFDI